MSVTSPTTRSRYVTSIVHSAALIMSWSTYRFGLPQVTLGNGHLGFENGVFIELLGPGTRPKAVGIGPPRTLDPFGMRARGELPPQIRTCGTPASGSSCIGFASRLRLVHDSR